MTSRICKYEKIKSDRGIVMSKDRAIRGSIWATNLVGVRPARALEARELLGVQKWESERSLWFGDLMLDSGGQAVPSLVS